MEENEKLLQLKGILNDAVKQIRKQLSAVGTYLATAQDTQQYQATLLTSLLLQIKELLNNFPRAKEEIQNGDVGDTTNFPSLLRRKLHLIVGDILLRLITIESFLSTTTSLPQTMTIAVCCREITKQFKVILPRGNNVINFPKENEIERDALSSQRVDFICDLDDSKIESLHFQDNKLFLAAEPTSENLQSSSNNINASNQQIQIIDSNVTINNNNNNNSNNNNNNEMMARNMSPSLSSPSLSIQIPSLTYSQDQPKLILSGFLKKLNISVGGLSKSWKSLWWTLDPFKLTSFQNETATIPVRAYPLSEFRSTSWGTKIHEMKEVEFNSIILIDKYEKKTFLSSDNCRDLIHWVCLIDSLMLNFSSETIFTTQDKNRLMRYLYRSGQFKGGEIKSSYDEEWSFSPDGVLQSEVITGPELKFRWDGETLSGLNAAAQALGVGKWNGVSLIWVHENESLPSPLHFSWDPFVREFTHSQDSNQVWKWTRHFLANKFGSGEWIVEGAVPEPVIMFLQLIHQVRS